MTPDAAAGTGLGASRALRLVLLLTGAVAALSVLTGSSWLVLVAGGLAGLVGQAVFRRPRLERVRVTVSGPLRTSVGATVRHELRVLNAGPGATPPLTVTHSLRGLPPAVVQVDPLEPGAQVAVDVTRTALSRGAAGSGQVTVTAADPLHLLVRVTVGTVARGLVVHPPATWPVPVPLAVSPVDGQRANRVGRGTDLSGVRQWRHGDAPRDVHWRSTARHGRLVVAERDVPTAEHLVLAVAGPLLSGDDERAVAVAASTAAAVRARGGQVTLLAWRRPHDLGSTGRESVLLTSANAGRTAALDWWAGLADLTVPAAPVLVEAVLDVVGAAGHPQDRAVASRPPVAVLVPSAVPQGWWTDLQAVARRRGVAVVAFP